MKSSARYRARAFVLAVAATGLLATGLVIHHRPRTLSEGERLPALSLSDLDGTSVQLGDTPARIAVYNVFTSWCPACNEELPQINRAAALLSRDGVAFVGIDQGESALQTQLFAAANGIRYPLLLDSGRITTSRLDARVIPTTLIVRDGVVRRIITGPTTSAQILADVKAL